MKQKRMSIFRHLYLPMLILLGLSSFAGAEKPEKQRKKELIEKGIIWRTYCKPPEDEVVISYERLTLLHNTAVEEKVIEEELAKAIALSQDSHWISSMNSGIFTEEEESQKDLAHLQALFFGQGFMDNQLVVLWSCAAQNAELYQRGLFLANACAGNLFALYTLASVLREPAPLLLSNFEVDKLTCALKRFGKKSVPYGVTLCLERLGGITKREVG